jgi:hypothetical protein
VAVKVIYKSTVTTDRHSQRIQKEVRFLKLLRHPNIVKVCMCMCVCVCVCVCVREHLDERHGASLTHLGLRAGLLGV